MKNRKGFTFVEMLIVMGIIAILATSVVVLINPAKRFEAARDKQREIHLQTILSAIEQKRTLEGGWFGFGCDPLPQEVEEIGGGEKKPVFKIIGTTQEDAYYDLYTCLVPIYLAEPLYDPAEGSEENTRYQIWQNPYSKRVTLLYEDKEKEKKIVAGPKKYGILSIPEVETTDVEEVYKEYISHYTAKVGGNVTDDGGAPVWERGVIWAKADIAEENLKLELVDMNTTFYKTIGSGEGLFSDTITGLTYETKYYVRAYARNDIGVGYGLKEEFETPDLRPIVTTLPATEVSVDRATLWGEVISCGGDPPFSNCYRYFKLNGQKTDYNYGPKGKFSIMITELGIGDYEFWACASHGRQGENERCSEVIETFKTQESVPIIAKPEIVRMGAYEAEIKGTIEHTGGLEVTEYGLCFTTIGRTLTYPDDCVWRREEIMPYQAPYDFTMTIPEEPERFSPGTKYWVFAFAKNMLGIGQSRELLEFRTGIEKPTMASEPIIQNADHYSAELGGTIAYDGGAPILEHGLCWGTLFDPKYCLFKGKPDKYAFAYRIKNFLVGTDYNIQAFAKNEKGWGFSGIAIFSPKPPAKKPVLGETEVVKGSITKTSAEFKGTILNHGGARIVNHGFCWDLFDVAPDPRYPPAPDEGGCIHLYSTDILPSGTDKIYEFSAVLPDGTLRTYTQYYVNAFAENTVGHGFQVGDVSFTTLMPDPPEVQTYDKPTTVSGRTALVGGKLISDGGDPGTKVGVCYAWNIEGDKPEYGKTYNDGGCVEGKRNEQGEFYVQLTGLTGGRWYNYRAYADNPMAISYGATYSFQAGSELGGICEADAECKSTQCVDKVCCNSRCGDICEACNIAGKVGTCIPAVGIDPRNNCTQGWSCKAYYSCKIDYYDGECAGKGVCRLAEENAGNIPLGYICTEPGKVFSTLEDVYTDQISEVKWCRKEENTNCGKEGNKCTSIKYLQYFSCAGTGVCRDPDKDGFDYNFETGEGLDFGVITENIKATKGKVLDSNCQFVTPSINNFCDRTINCIPGQCSAQRWFRGCEADGTQNCTEYNKVLRTPNWPTTADHLISQDGQPSYRIGISCSETLSPCGDCQWCQGGVCKNEFYDTRNTPTNIATVKIGNQCWMAQNLNVGTRISGTLNQGTSCADIKKYCYDNSDTNCTSNRPTYPDGGLYQWNQAMCGSTTPGAQGICPGGWHIPTITEWSTFEANLAGHRSTAGVFAGRGEYAGLWSSTQYTNKTAWYRSLYKNDSNVYNLLFDKTGGFSVRCIKD